MSIDTQTLKVDVSKQMATMDVLTLGQGDSNGTNAVFDVYDDGAAFSLAGYGVRLVCHLPHDAGYWAVDGTASGNTATFAVDETYAAAVDGQGFAYVEILDGDTVVCSTSRVVLNVLRSAYDGVSPSKAYTNGVAEFLESAEGTLDDAVKAASDDVAATIAAANAALGKAASEASSAIADAEESLQQAEQELSAALEALGDISEISVPLMSATVRGGAKLGEGLNVEDGALSAGIVFGYEESGGIDVPVVTITY